MRTLRERRLRPRAYPEVQNDRSSLKSWITIEKWPSLSTFRLFTLASWPRCAARLRRARLARRGGQDWIKSGSSFAASQACGPMATTFFSITTRQNRAGRSCATSAWRSRAHLKPRARCMRLRRRGGECRCRHPPRARKYDRMNEAHDASLRKWMAGECGKCRAGQSLGDLRRSDTGSGQNRDDDRVHSAQVAFVRGTSGQKPREYQPFESSSPRLNDKPLARVLQEQLCRIGRTSASKSSPFLNYGPTALPLRKNFAGDASLTRFGGRLTVNETCARAQALCGNERCRFSS